MSGVKPGIHELVFPSRTDLPSRHAVPLTSHHLWYTARNIHQLAWVYAGNTRSWVAASPSSAPTATIDSSTTSSGVQFGLVDGTATAETCDFRMMWHFQQGYTSINTLIRYSTTRDYPLQFRLSATEFGGSQADGWWTADSKPGPYQPSMGPWTSDYPSRQGGASAKVVPGIHNPSLPLTVRPHILELSVRPSQDLTLSTVGEDCTVKIMSMMIWDSHEMVWPDGS